MSKKNMVQNTDFVEFVEGSLDGMIESGFPPTSINMESACDSFRPDRDTMNYVVSTFNKLYEEVSSSDDDLVEAYGHIGKRQNSNLLKFIGEVVSIQDYVPKEKVKVSRFRKPRKRKEKTPTQLVAKLPHCTEDKDLNLTSVPVEKIVNSKGVIFYNTKNRKLMLFVARKGLFLSVKGAKILNYDVDISGMKTLRSPAESLEQFQKLTLAKSKKEFKAIKAKHTDLTGSINKNCLLLKVF